MGQQERLARMVVLRRERRSEGQVYTDYYVAREEVADPEAALRSAVDEFLFTDEGREMILYTSEDYNWGDASMSLTDDVLSKHGMERLREDHAYTLNGEVVEVVVNQDEVLVEWKHLDEMEEDDE